MMLRVLNANTPTKGNDGIIEVETRYHVNQHLPKYFRMTADDMKGLEGRLDEIYGKPDK